MNNENYRSLVPPQNQDAEMSVLGAMLIDKNAIIDVAGQLLPDYFYEEKHKQIYSCVLELFEESSPVDIVTLTAKLRAKKWFKKVGGASYLTDLASYVPTASHVQQYAKIVRENAMRRTLISSAAKISELGFNEEMDVSEVVDNAQKLLFDVASDGVETNFVHIRDLMGDAFERIRAVDEGEESGITTGFEDLDKLLGGFKGSDLIILAARPSVGKTSLALDFLRSAAVKGKSKIAFFSLEMDNKSIIDRLLGMHAMVPFWEMRTGNMDEGKFEKISNAMGELADADIFIDDKPGQSINEVRTKARRLALEHGLDMIIVDYLQLMRGTHKERHLEVQEISQGLKNIARELQVPVVALSQLSRSIESRQSRRPMLSDLRESGSIEQDADIIMFIDREEQSNPETERKGVGDLFVAKHRNGPTGDIELAFIKEIASFRNLSKKQYE